ncbi:MAG: hypothetical protein HZB56_10455 [Deltaproteobacteria bacterium]|nr:hypothetical protein [Deltaproteobacteria bacterium]
MRVQALAAALLLGLGGCSLSIDPDKVPEPLAQSCTPTGCAGKSCGYNDCGNVCQPGSGCTGTCAPFCSGVACGAGDGCGATCSVGSGCVPGGTTSGTTVGAGGIRPGAARMYGASFQVEGSLGKGSAPQTLQSGNYRIEQGTLR